MNAIIWLIDQVLYLYWWIVLFSVIITWLYHFGVINSSNQYVNAVGKFLYQMTEPVFSRIRRFLPAMGGIDFSPIIVLLGIGFLQYLLKHDIAPLFR